MSQVSSASMKDYMQGIWCLMRDDSSMPEFDETGKVSCSLPTEDEISVKYRSSYSHLYWLWILHMPRCVDLLF